MFVEFDGSYKDGQLEIKIVAPNKIQAVSLDRLELALNPYFSRIQLKDDLNNQLQHKDIIPTPDEFEIQTYTQIFEEITKFYNDEII